MLVYRDDENVCISGVGQRNDDRVWRAPKVIDGDQFVSFAVMGVKRETGDDYTGFVLHNACWELLQKASIPHEVSLELLISACESLPVLAWYRKVYNGDTTTAVFHKHEIENAHPWLETFYGRMGGELVKMGAYVDPFSSMDFQTLTNRPTALPEVMKQHPGLCRTWNRGGVDIFSKLPWELRDMIITRLPTADVLNLRMASRCFCKLFSDHRFWWSRFEPDGDRGFLWEVREKSDLRISDLVLIYRLSSKSSMITKFMNRVRVWSLARQLGLLVQSPRVLTSLIEEKVSDLSLDKPGWLRISCGDKKISAPLENANNDPFGMSPRSLRTIELEVADDVVRIAVALTQTSGSWDYVTGIKLISEDGHEQVAGRGFDHYQFIYRIDELHGFRVAMGPNGLRALQAVGEHGVSNRWIGGIHELPISQRLIANTPITHISVTLDVSIVITVTVRLLMALNRDTKSLVLEFARVVHNMTRPRCSLCEMQLFGTPAFRKINYI